MKLKFLLGVCLITGTFVSKGQAPNADFTTPKTTITAGDCCDFFDLSTNNPVAWTWYFYGASQGSSNAQNPTNICYDYPGTYPVTLEVSNASGTDVETRTTYITVERPVSELHHVQCGQLVNLSGPFIMETVFIGQELPEDYRLTIINNGGSFYYKSVTSGGSVVISKSEFPGLEWERKYNAVVQVKFNGTWGAFGPVCEFYTSDFGFFRNNRSSVNSVAGLSLNLYPNPAEQDEFNFNLTGLREQNNQIQIEVYDLFGKQVHKEQFSHGDSELQKRLSFNETISSGVYLVRVNVNGEVLQEKIKVQ